ncbi:signal peptidase I [Inhella gelatinilytica]|uniref:Signal peptidase I n=1 Tax=Inhella gelatinilytica TaxID=2795030 RepID=A0A931NF93_9BURK|nr:signal peptidase I [Inhella gelatinilytica]MBH9553296.1 signal peptidase I [Inhella gelatinilytica]
MNSELNEDHPQLSALTAFLYAVLVVYLGGWYLDKWTGNFALLLFLMSVVTFFYWIAERWYFLPRREAAARALVEQDAQRRAKLSAEGIKVDHADIEGARRAVLRQPWWLDWTAGLFPVIVLVFGLRSFLFEPFRIPSGSMVPTLLVGDLILVNKFHYGVRLPVINKKIWDNQPVRRGDVMVFRFPEDPRMDYIKRVVGLPGDVVSWRNQTLSINGQEVKTDALGPYFDQDSLRERPRYRESLGERPHDMLVNRSLPLHFRMDTANGPFPHAENCQYGLDGVTCTVPAGHYFMLGDNRDNSRDSRFWGFVPDANIVGKAVFIWMNLGDPKRIGGFD